MAEITLEATINSVLTIFDKSYIKEVSWITQNSGDYTQPFYGMISAVGEIKIIDRENLWFNYIMAGYILDGLVFTLRVNGKIIGSLIVSKDGASYDKSTKILTLQVTDKTQKYELINCTSYEYNYASNTADMMFLDTINSNLDVEYQISGYDHILDLYDIEFPVLEVSDMRSAIDKFCVLSQSYVRQTADGSIVMYEVFSNVYHELGYSNSYDRAIIIPNKYQSSSFDVSLIPTNLYDKVLLDYNMQSPTKLGYKKIEVFFPTTITDFGKQNANFTAITYDNDGTNYFVNCQMELTLEDCYKESYATVCFDNITYKNDVTPPTLYGESNGIAVVLYDSSIYIPGNFYCFDRVASKAEFDAIPLTTSNTFGKFGLQRKTTHTYTLYMKMHYKRISDPWLSYVQNFALYINAQIVKTETITLGTGNNAYVIPTSELIGKENTFSITSEFVINKITQKVYDTYSYGLKTAKIEVVPATLYREDGTLAINWANGDMLDVDSMVRIDKNNSNDSALYYSDGTTSYYWKVCSREFVYEGVPRLKLELIELLPTYRITYNANGGSGAPNTQDKYYNRSLTLTTAMPTRSGYTFVRWNTLADGTGTNYSSGATYSVNANLYLYAVWLFEYSYQWVFHSEGSSDPSPDNYVINNSVTSAAQALTALNNAYPPAAIYENSYLSVCPSDYSYFWTFVCEVI